MNKVILDQLSKVTSTQLPDISNEMIIPKTFKILNTALHKDTTYLIELSDEVFSLTGSTLSANWNAGRVPKHKLYIVELVDSLPNMLKFQGVAQEDTTEDFYYWVPINWFRVISKL